MGETTKKSEENSELKVETTEKSRKRLNSWLKVRGNQENGELTGETTKESEENFELKVETTENQESGELKVDNK